MVRARGSDAERDMCDMAEQLIKRATRIRPVEPRRSRFTLLSEPIPTSLTEVGEKGFTTLIAGGIVNPFGPTLNVLTVDGHFRTAVGRLRVLLIALNPFLQSCHTVGHVEMGDVWSPPDDLEPFRACLPFRACPTLLIPSTFMTVEVARDFYATFLATFHDAAEVLDRVRQYPGDPWRRIVRTELMFHAERSGDLPVARRHLDHTEAVELARTQLAPEYVRSELVAFLDAWEGAIQFQSGDTLAPATMPVEEFVALFAQLCATCHLPFLA